MYYVNIRRVKWHNKFLVVVRHMPCLVAWWLSRHGRQGGRICTADEDSEDSEDSGNVPGHSLQGLDETWIGSGRPRASFNGVDKRTARTRFYLLRGYQSE